jgi:hypothetical protein
MADLRVDIKTTADISGANAATDALKATTAAANQLGGAAGSAATAVTGTQDALKETSKQASELSNQLVETARRADEAQSAIGAVDGKSGGAADAVNVASKATNQLGASFSDLIRRGSPAHELLDGVLQGSLRSSTGVLALTRAVTGLFRGFSAGGIGLFVTALAGATGVALLLAKNLNLVGDSAEEIKKKFEDSQKSIEKTAATNFNTLSTSLKHVGEEVDREKAKFEALAAAKERIDNAERAAAIELNKTNTKITEEQRVKNEETIREKFRTREQERTIEKKTEAVSEAQKVVSGTTQVAQPAEREFSQAVKDFQSLLVKQGEQQSIEAERSELQAKRTAFGAKEEDQGLSLREIEITKQQQKATPVTDNDIALARKRVEETTKAVDTEREAIDVAKERLEVAKSSLSLELATQKKENEFHKVEQRAELVPKLADAAATDRAKKVATQKEQANPEAAKLTAVNQTLDERIKLLTDQMLKSQLSSKDPSNVARQTEIDSLRGRQSQNETSIDAFNRAPTKTDVRNTDLKAAGKEADKALKLDTKPINDAEQKKNDEVLKLAQDNNAGLKNIADTITALPPPPKPDTTPVLAGLIEYNGQTIAAFKGVNQNFIEIGKTLRAQGQQIEALTRQLAQATP